MAYTFVFVWGISFVKNKSYFYNPDNTFSDFPVEVMDWNEHTFYLVQMGYYIHMIVSVFTDVRRSDFLEYIVHHCVTLFLIRKCSVFFIPFLFYFILFYSLLYVS